jgi:hypothetical protein
METRKSRRGGFPSLPKRRTVNVTSLAAGHLSPPVKRNVRSAANNGTRNPHVKSLGTGTMRANSNSTRSRVIVNVSMDNSSLALGSKQPGLLDNFSSTVSVGSTTLDDSFVNALESF